MKVSGPERRLFPRHSLKTPLRLRIWQAGNPEQSVESENLSEGGAFISTDSPVRVGSTVEVLLKMPKEITGKSAIEWRCTGRVVRVQTAYSSLGRAGVGVEFDNHEIVRSKSSESR
jgi:Tfp pilus assembly protein PilZ